MNYRRINLIGGPGVGKSCNAQWLGAMLKFKHRNCELVQEYVKSWAYEGRKPYSYKQHKIFANQMDAEDTLLANGVDFIISDSPIYLAACYGSKFDVPGWETILIVAKEFNRTFPGLNIFLERDKSLPYQPMGRFQTREEALEMDKLIFNTLQAYNIPMTLIPTTQREKMLVYIEEQLAFLDA